MTTFRILWALDLVLAAIIGFYFVLGLADGTISSFIGGIWFIILFSVGAVLLSAWMLRPRGHTRLACLQLLVLAAPGGLYFLFLLVAVFSGTRWN